MSLQCLSAVSQFETPKAEANEDLTASCLQCLSAVSQFETDKGVQERMNNAYMSPVPFGGVSV